MFVDYSYKDEINKCCITNSGNYDGVYLSPQDGYIYLVTNFTTKPLKMCKPEQLTEIYISDDKKN